MREGMQVDYKLGIEFLIGKMQPNAKFIRENATRMQKKIQQDKFPLFGMLYIYLLFNNISKCS